MVFFLPTYIHMSKSFTKFLKKCKFQYFSRSRIIKSNCNEQNNKMPAARRRHRGSYESLQTEIDNNSIDDLDSYGVDDEDLQFYNRYDKKLPWKTISFVLFFFIVGTICMTTAGLIFTEVIDQKYVDRASPLLILGCLMLIPGGYYSYIMASILMKREGFSWEDVPEL